MSKKQSGSDRFNNYILLGADLEELKKKAVAIVEEKRESHPERFNAESSMIPWIMNYTAPFDKSFSELFRLQAAALTEARFKDEFRGYIVLDVSEFLQHEQEKWFDISLKFFYDQQEFWRYVFLVDTTKAKAAEAMCAKILSLCYCHVKDYSEREKSVLTHPLKEQCQELGLRCTEQTLAFFQMLIEEQTASRKVLSALLNELSEQAYKTVDLKRLQRHFAEKTSIVRYMVKKQKFDEFCRKLEMQVTEGEMDNEKI